MNEDRYNDIAWFDALEAAANKEIATYNQVQSWAKPAPKRAVSNVSTFTRIARFLGL
jgi:hypothetical protein